MIWTSTEQIASFLQAMADAADQELRARGQRIAELRNARGWSQEDLAHAIGVGVGTVSRWERGLHAGYPEHIRKLAEALEVPISELSVPLPSFLDQLERIEAELSRQGILLDALGELMEQQLGDRVTAAARRARGPARRTPRAAGRKGAA